MSVSRMIMGQAANPYAAPTYIEDVFSTYLYTGNSSTQTITNGIDLAGEGGMVWTKPRNDTQNHGIHDTERGVNKILLTNTTNAEITRTSSLTSFNSDGFTLGNDAIVNTSPYNYVSWTFRKAPRFFDVVTWTGTDSTHTISHNLGSEVGFMVVKRYSSGTGEWYAWHRDLTSGHLVRLNATVASATNSTFSNVTSTSFTVNGGGYHGNAIGEQYVAYLFAHDPLGPSGDGSDGLIACGSLTTSASAEFEVTLGWEPQFVLMKRTDSTGNWEMFDTMRGFPNSTNGAKTLRANLNNAESTLGSVGVTSTGFKTYDTLTFPSSATYIYIAIRRGPMRQPTSGTEVFAMDTYDTTTGDPTAYDTTFPIDAAWQALNKSTTTAHRWSARITGGEYLVTSSTAAGTTVSAYEFDNQTGFRTDPGTDVNDFAWMLRRAPGFFDVVAYTGDGVAGRTVSHNLGVAPELVIIKQRSGTQKWSVGSTAFPSGGNMVLNETGGIEGAGGTARFYYAGWDALNFGIGQDLDVNGSGSTYIAYLFASCPGVSKVGSYTGNGTSQTIDCGFTSGARFVLIKRTDATDEWTVFDSVRGITSNSSDPLLYLNTTDAEFTESGVYGSGTIDPDPSGFTIKATGFFGEDLNASGGTYIFLAIA